MSNSGVNATRLNSNHHQNEHVAFTASLRPGGGGYFRNFCDAEAGWYKNVNHWLVFLLNELKFIKIENPPIKYIY